MNTTLFYRFILSVGLIECVFFCVYSQTTDSSYANFHLGNVKRSLERFLGSNLDEPTTSTTNCLLCLSDVPEHRTVVNTFLEKDLSLSTLRRFIRRESILLSDSLADRLKTAVDDLKFCDSFIDQELKFFQDDTLYFYKILIAKQANLSFDANGKLKEKFLFATIRYEIIFALLPENWKNMFDCLTKNDNSSPLDVNNNSLRSEDLKTCFAPSDIGMTYEIWSNFTDGVQRRAIAEFKRQQKRKIDYVLNKTENNAFDYSLFNEKCSTGLK